MGAAILAGLEALLAKNPALLEDLLTALIQWITAQLQAANKAS